MAKRMLCRLCWRACVHYQFEQGFVECRLCDRIWRRLLCTRCHFITTRVFKDGAEHCGLCRSMWRMPPLRPIPSAS